MVLKGLQNDFPPYFDRDWNSGTVAPPPRPPRSRDVHQYSAFGCARIDFPGTDS